MSTRNDAKDHLAKAAEFLVVARVAYEGGYFSAVVANAVTSAINSKDAICLTLVGSSRKSDDHGSAVAELRAAGSEASGHATTLARLLSMKTKSQYDAKQLTVTQARTAVEQAQRLHETAIRVTSG